VRPQEKRGRNGALSELAHFFIRLSHSLRRFKALPSKMRGNHE
jgi:hypothetical protein